MSKTLVAYFSAQGKTAKVAGELAEHLGADDNLPALRFYQKRGFDMSRLFCNAVDLSRKLKPEIPLFGIDGIPLKHEIELEMNL
jgi:hypothetical protein